MERMYCSTQSLPHRVGSLLPLKVIAWRRREGDEWDYKGVEGGKVREGGREGSEEEVEVEVRKERRIKGCREEKHTDISGLPNLMT